MEDPAFHGEVITDLRGSHWWYQWLKQHCREQSPGGYQVECEPTMHYFGKEGILNCIRRSVTSKSREVILALSLALVRCIWTVLSSSGLQLKRRHGRTEENPAKGHWHNYRTGAYDIHRMALFSMKKIGLKGTLLMWISIGRGKVQRRQSQDLSRTGPEAMSTHWNMGSPYGYRETFTMKVTEPWNKLPRELLKSPLEMLKSHLDTALLEVRDWTGWPPEVPANSPSVILWHRIV